MSNPLTIDGRIVRESLVQKIQAKIAGFSFKPTLAIIQVGAREDSSAFIRAKKLFAEKIGVGERHIQVNQNISQNDLLKIVGECNADKSIQGIIVQLPLPAHLDQNVIIDAISPDKDADGITSTNVSKWKKGDKSAIWPATARGVRELLEYYKISLKGKNVVVVGRSPLVGQPLESMCLSEGAKVTVCHSQTPDTASVTRKADIIITAVGKINLITADHVSKDQVVIDVGINTIQGNKLDEEVTGRKLVGDVDFDNVSQIVKAISPVPGGVGPMTVLCLFENLLDLCENR